VVNEAKVLRQVLEDDRVLSQAVTAVMDPPLPEVSAQESAERAKSYLSQRDGAVLVRDGDRLIGIVTRYDLIYFIL
jgi:predicted transcriptional regulator